MTVAMVYLITPSSQSRLALPANGDVKTANSKAIMAAECATELLNRAIGSRASIRAFVLLSIANKYFRRNRAAAIMVGWLLSYWSERENGRAATAPSTAGLLNCYQN